MVRWLYRFQFLLMFIIILAVIGYRYELISYTLLTLGYGLGFLSLLIMVILSLVILLISLIPSVDISRTPIIISFMITLTPVAIILMMIGPSGFQAPVINDISTDTLNPPSFSMAGQIRKVDENSVNYHEKGFAAKQIEFYPEVQPLIVYSSKEVVFQTIDKSLSELQWDIVSKRLDDGVVEAVETSDLFGFRDDIVIRVSSVGESYRIDVRSASRVGKTDLGVNAKRIMNFFKVFEGNLPQS